MPRTPLKYSFLAIEILLGIAFFPLLRFATAAESARSQTFQLELYDSNGAPT